MVLWYNLTMKKEFLKESGKYLLDLSKIMFAIALITPLAKGQDFSIAFAIAIFFVGASGFYLTYKGAKDE